MILTLMTFTAFLAIDNGNPRPLFAAEKWYQDSKESEKTVEGVLEATVGDGHIGLPARFNAFRLAWLEDGKPQSRPIYTNGKDNLLGPFIGHRVKLTTKLVEVDTESGKAKEFWPGQLEDLGVAPPGSISDLKIHARSDQPFAALLFQHVKPGAVVIRDGKRAAEIMGFVGAGNANQETLATNRLSQMLGRRGQGIDWSKEMVLCVAGGLQAGDARVNISRISVRENGLDVYWKLNNLGGGFGGAGISMETVLVDRHDVEIRFHQESGPGRPEQVITVAPDAKKPG